MQKRDPITKVKAFAEFNAYWQKMETQNNNKLENRGIEEKF
jgi:hypothetical protein